MNQQLTTTSNEPTELLAPSDSFGLRVMNPADIPNLDEAETGMSLEMKYYEFNTPGQVVRAIFNGMSVMSKRKQNSGEMEQLPAVVFQTKDGVYINGGDNLVSQLRTIPAGTPIEIKYEGKEKTGGGFNVNKFTVRLLNVLTYRQKLEKRYSQLLAEAAPLGITAEPVESFDDVGLIKAGKELSAAIQTKKSQAQTA